VAEKLEEAKLLQHEFWDALSALESALGIEIDGNKDLDEAGVAELIEKAVETGNAENLCPVCGSGPGVVCTCVHPNEREEE
jgi:formate dehydrogenase maturation protein FdhE